MTVDPRALRVLTPTSPNWPAGLNRLPDPPGRLWALGPARPPATAPTDGAPTVAIIGSRAATSYGEHAATTLARDLATAGITILSGGGYGIDAAAHRGALAAAGHTVLIAPAGLDRPYPPGNAALHRRIGEAGLQLSAYPPGTPPARARFAERNHLLAAIPAAVIVVEAARRSGALDVAARAVALGVPVLALPGPVTSAQSTGCHALLRAGTARLIESAADALAALDPARPPAPEHPARVSQPTPRAR